MADRKLIKPLATLDDVVVVDITSLLGTTRPREPRAAAHSKRKVDLQPAKTRPAELPSRQDMLDIVRKVPNLELKESGKPAGDLRLSPRGPHVAGRGHLTFYGARIVSAEGDSAYFDYDEPGLGEVEVWLHGLQQGGSYLAQIRLTGPTGGHFRLRGSDTGGEILFGSGYQKTVIAVMQDLTYDMSLLIIEAVGLGYWTFHDITVAPL